MKTLQVSDNELRSLLVTTLEVLSAEEFESAQAVARRLRDTVGRILVSCGCLGNRGSWVAVAPVYPSQETPRA